MRLRLYQLRNDEQSLPSVDGSIQQNVDLESVRTQEEVEESIKALLFDEEMDTLGQSCIDDGEWEPMIQVNWFFLHFIILSFKPMFKQENGSTLTIVSTSHSHKNVSFKCIFFHLHFVL